jgi:hypothetical protein
MNNLLWDYADGLLSEQEAEKIRLLLQENPAYQQQLNAILKEKEALSNVNLEWPKRSFADSVMAKWTMEQYDARKAASAHKQPQADWILRAIGGLMAAFTIIPLLLLIVSGGNAKTNLPFSFDLTQKLTLPKVDYVAFFSNPLVFYTFTFGLIYLGLQIFDRFLQRKFILT